MNTFTAGSEHDNGGSGEGTHGYELVPGRCGHIWALSSSPDVIGWRRVLSVSLFPMRAGSTLGLKLYALQV